MLSTAAFNALPKTLEEPPAHVKFIFATTDVHKVLPTISHVVSDLIYAGSRFRILLVVCALVVKKRVLR